MKIGDRVKIGNANFYYCDHKKGDTGTIINIWWKERDTVMYGVKMDKGLEDYDKNGWSYNNHELESA